MHKKTLGLVLVIFLTLLFRVFPILLGSGRQADMILYGEQAGPVFEHLNVYQVTYKVFPYSPIAMPLPALCMALSGFAFLARFTRSSLLEVMHQDYIRTAKAKGAGASRIFFGHVLRSALIPFVTLFGLILPEMVAGSVIIESIFSWPGLGQLYLKAVYTRDYPVIMAESVLGAALVLLGSVLTDLGYHAVDPRTRR